MNVFAYLIHSTFYNIFDFLVCDLPFMMPSSPWLEFTMKKRKVFAFSAHLNGNEQHKSPKKHMGACKYKVVRMGQSARPTTD